MITLDIVLTWIAHTLAAIGINIVCLLLGVSPIGGAFYYIGREHAQHDINGTKGLINKIDRFMDMFGPIVASIVMVFFDAYRT